MDRIPPHKIDRSRAVEDAAKLKDITERAKVARPVDAGRDILAGFDGDGRPLTIDTSHPGSRF